MSVMRQDPLSGRCLLCDLLDREREAASRLVAENEDWAALTPWASSFPYEMMVLPRRHQGSMIETREEEFASLGRLLQEILSRLARLAGFEVGTGFAINSLWPEEAASRLRKEGTAP